MPWTEPAAVLDYWIGPDDISPAGWAEKQQRWYAASDDIDSEIRARFGNTLTAAENGELSTWQHSLKGQLAMIVLYDQFSRNLYRGTGDVYKNDPQAQAVADNIIESGRIDTLNVPACILVLHAWHHAEDKKRQIGVVKQGERLLARCDEAWRELVQNKFNYMKNHSGIILEFGRFPHRNKLLGRTSTAQERVFLKKDNRAYGQRTK